MQAKNIDNNDGQQNSQDLPGPEIGAAFITYAFILFIKVSGLDSLFNYQHPANPLAAPPLRDIGEFIFFDAILLAVVGLVCSGVLLTLAINDDPPEKYRRLKLIAATGVGVPGIIYLVGSVVVAIS